MSVIKANAVDKTEQTILVYKYIVILKTKKKGTDFICIIKIAQNLKKTFFCTLGAN